MKRGTHILAAFLSVFLSLSYLQVGSMFAKAELQGQSVGSKGLFYVLVNSTIYSGIESSVTQYATDLQSEGYSVNIQAISGGTAVEIRSLLASALPNGLVGVCFVGDIPEAQYEDGSEKFPIDLFYMDLDGTWIDQDGDNMYDGHTGDVAPEIYVGRLKASNIDGDQVSMINSYFQKVHNYRMGTLSLPKRVLIYIDDDWASAADSYNIAVKAVYDETTVVNDPVTTNASDYEKRINVTEGEGYEWLHLGCHGNPTGHTFKVPDNVWDGSVRSSDYRTINPKVMFYNFYSCLIANYDVSDNLASTIVLATSYGLLVVGSTRAGAMDYVGDFYGPVSQGKSIGTAFQDWFIKHGESGLRVYYGLTVIGDPTLYVVEPGERVHDVAVTSVTMTPTVSRAVIGGTMTITVVVENQGNRNATFNVATYYNNTRIGTQTVTDLAVGYSVTLIFIWNTTGVSSGIYTIKAVADTLVGEADTVDNVKIYGTIALRLWRPMENMVKNSGWETGDNSFWQVSVTKMPSSQVKNRVNQNSGINGTFGFNVNMQTVTRSRPTYTSQSLMNIQSLNKATLDVVTKLDYWVYPNYRLYGTTTIPNARWEVVLYFSTGNKLHYYGSLNMEPVETSTDKYVLTPLTFDKWNQFLDTSVLTTYTAKFGTPPIGTAIVQIALYVTSCTYSYSGVYNEVIANFDSDEVVGGLQVGRPAQNVNTGLAYTSIQEAINAPETLDGHTIQVFEGTYGQSVVVNKSVTLIGEEPSITIIDLQNQQGTAFNMTTSDVTITGFTIRNCYYGILIERNCAGNTATNNRVINATCGIKLQTYSHGNIVINNLVTNGYCGIELNGSDDNLVDNNRVLNNNYGIILTSQLEDSANNNNVSGNTISNNTYGAEIITGYNNTFRVNIIENSTYGFYLYSDRYSNISGNTIRHNTYGLYIYGELYSTVSSNTISYNTYGLSLNNSEDGTFFENKISNNGFGIYLYISTSNIIHHNNFINNTVQAYTYESNNTWISINFVGNYWSDHTGQDVYGDGIGDTSYVIDEYNIDRYPLVWKWFPGDLNGDGDVDDYDLSIFAGAYGSLLDPAYNPECDLDDDGDVDDYDLWIFARAYGSRQGEPAYNPECDLDDDGDVDDYDFSIFVGAYGTTIEPYNRLADLDYDCNIDYDDLTIFSQNYLKRDP